MGAEALPPPLPALALSTSLHCVFGSGWPLRQGLAALVSPHCHEPCPPPCLSLPATPRIATSDRAPLSNMGQFPGPGQEGAGQCRRLWLVPAAPSVGCELSGREPYLPSANCKVYRPFTDFYLTCKSADFCKCSCV